MTTNTPTTSDYLVIVDVQPGYRQDCHLMMPEIVDKIKNTTQKIIFFYVGKELDMDSKYDVIGLLLEYGVEEHKLDEIKFIEKDYGFFRSWMDSNVDDEIILNAIKFMHESKIYDSRDFTKENWAQIIGNDQHNHRVIFGDPIFYPGFDNRLIVNNFVDNIELIGGGRYECLEEIRFYLAALGKTTSVTETLCYGGLTTSVDYNNKTKKSKIR